MASSERAAMTGCGECSPIPHEGGQGRCECTCHDDLGTCTMCEQTLATTTWGFPVCQPCADMLSTLDDDLKKMEAGDPALKVAGERVEAAWAEFQRLRDQPPVEVNRTLPPPARWREAVSKLLWRLHLYRLSGWWDAGTDARRINRGR